MSLKVYNNKTKAWEKQSSMLATSIQVLDVDNSFEVEKTSVENCFKEVKGNISDLKNDVKYIYENGTIGGGGGSGGGSVLPVVSIKSHAANQIINVNASEKVRLQYSWTSPNRGGGTAILTDHNGKVTKVATTPTPDLNTWEVGPFPRRGEPYQICIEVVDSQQFASVAEYRSILSGAISISSTFDEDTEFTMEQNVDFPIDIQGIGGETMILRCTYRGKPHPTLDGMIVTNGPQTLPFGKLAFMGSSRVTFKIETESKKYESETLVYNFIVTDSKNLTISSKFESEFTWAFGDPLSIDYRLSKKGEYGYLVDYYIDNMDTPVETGIEAEPSPDTNFWNLGTSLAIREKPYRLKITAHTLDGLNSASMEFVGTISLDGFVPHEATPGALAHFTADGKSNSDKWMSEKKDYFFDLKGFNFSTNGFKDQALRFEGESYAVLNHSPFANGLPPNGFTFEITYKSQNTGDMDGRVVHLHNGAMNGFYMDTERLRVQTNGGSIAETFYQDQVYVTQTIVYDPFYKITPKNPEYENNQDLPEWLPEEPNGVIKIFTNGIVSSVDYFNTKVPGFRDMFKYSGKIVLGAKPANDAAGNQSFLTMDAFASCDIKSIRIYEKYLTDEQVLDNYISLQHPDEQRTLIKVNDMRTDIPYAGMPFFKIAEDVSDLGEDNPKTTNVTFTDFLDTSLTLTNATAEVTWQGTSSKAYPVRNYTVKLKAGDGGVHQKVDYAPTKDWLPEPRWTLKANYMDSSQANNIGVAKFIHQFFKEYAKSPYPQQQKNPNTRACVDGIPVRLWIGDDDSNASIGAGVYTLNIDRYANQNYGFDTYEQIFDENKQVIGAAIKRHGSAVSYEFAGNNTPSSRWETDDFQEVSRQVKHRYNFRESESNPVAKTEHGSNNEKIDILVSEPNHTELMNLMRWMSQLNNASEFKAEASNHWSIDHLIDYYLICMMFGLVDSLGKNMVITTFGATKDEESQDLITKWYPSFYDSDTALGVSNSGQVDISSGTLPDEYVENQSRLWEFLLSPTGYLDEVIKRYKYLTNPKNFGNRPTPFSYEYMISFFEDQAIGKIGQKYYNQDAESKYIKKKQFKFMCRGSRLSFTKRWLRERCNFIDSYFESDRYTARRIFFRSNVGVENGELFVKAYQPIMVKFQPNDGGVPVKMRVDSTGTKIPVNIVNDKNNNASLYGSDHIMQVDGLQSLNISFISITEAPKITNLNVRGNKILTQIEMVDNPFLRDIDLSGCTSLGTDTTNAMLNLENCVNIRTVNLNNTKLMGVQFNKNGGYLNTLDLRSTKVQSIDLKDQIYLHEERQNDPKGLFIDASAIENFTKISLDGCDEFLSLKVPRSRAQEIVINKCKNMTTLDIEGATGLNSIKTILCPKLKTLKLVNISGPGVSTMEGLDLTTVTNLEELNISNSDIQFIKFPHAFTGLKKFHASGSKLTSIGFGVNAEFTANDALDLKPFSLTELSMSGCRFLKIVNNLKFNGNPSFAQCSALTAINGSLTLSGAVGGIFSECGNLAAIPNINAAGVTSFNSTFWSASKITWAHASHMFSTVSDKLTSTVSMFQSCHGLAGPIPVDFFKKAVNLENMSDMFKYSRGVTGGIGQELRYSSKLKNTSRAFRETGMTQVPTNVSFANNKILENMYEMFYGCYINTAPESNLFQFQKGSSSKLVNVFSMLGGNPMEGSLPVDIFKDLPNLNNVYGFFSGSRITGEIPANFLDVNNGNNNLLANTGTLFSGCTGITGRIPRTLLDLSPGLLDMRNMFDGCTGLVGAIPEGFLSKNTAVREMQNCFRNCRNIGTSLNNGEINQIPKSLFKGKKALTNMERIFENCIKLGGIINVGMFDDCSSLSNIAYAFNECETLNGTLPNRISTITVEKRPDPNFPDTFPDIFIEVEVESDIKQLGIFDNAKLSVVDGVFAGCWNLTGSIPETFLRGATASLVSAQKIFERCYQLTGSIPERFFWNASKLENVSSCFNLCRSLDGYTDRDQETGLDVKYILPEKIFAKNPNLKYANSTFYMYQELSRWPLKFGGKMPNDLFKANTKLMDCNSLFGGASNITGNLTADTFNKCKDLSSIKNSFWGTNISSMDRNLFSTCANKIDFYEAFYACANLTGLSFDINKVNARVKTKCFAGTNFSNKSELQANGWM